MHLRAYNRKLLQEGCTLDQLVHVIIPPSARDPLVAKRELPRFGLNSGLTQNDYCSEEDGSSVKTVTTRPSTQISQDEERFAPYEKAARRNYILSKDLGRFELRKSPLGESVVGTSAYPEAELTPELRQRRGAIQAYKSLRKLDTRAPSHSPRPSIPRTAHSSQKRRKDPFDKQLACLHKVLDKAYQGSLPCAANYVASHSHFLRKSHSPILGRQVHTTKSFLRRTANRRRRSKEETLSGEDVLTILTSYKEEQAASRMAESRNEDRKIATNETPRRTAAISRSKSPTPTCQTLELVGIEDKSRSCLRFPKRTMDHPNQARFKLPPSGISELKIEVESRFMQIVQASLSPKFEGRGD